MGDEDKSQRHKLLSLQVLTHPNNESTKGWLEDCCHSFAQMICDKLSLARDAEEAKTKVGILAVPVFHSTLSRFVSAEFLQILTMGTD